MRTLASVECHNLHRHVAASAARHEAHTDPEAKVPVIPAIAQSPQQVRMVSQPGSRCEPHARR